MAVCLEKCDKFARSKSARIFYGILLVLACCVGIIHLLKLSNSMAEQKLSNIMLVIEPDDDSLYHFGGTTDKARAWSTKLGDYLSQINNSNHQKCNYTTSSPAPDPDRLCAFELDEYGPCSPKNNYGLSETSLCVFLKLRKNPSWSPSFYNTSSLSVEMPSDLRNYIKYKSSANNKNVAWMSCQGSTPADIENIGPITYIPERGFSFPLKSTTFESLEPVVAVYFEKPLKGIVISVECQLWTRNTDDSVSFHFML